MGGRVDRVGRRLEDQRGHLDVGQLVAPLEAGLVGNGMGRGALEASGVGDHSLFESSPHLWLEGEFVAVEQTPVLDPPCELGVGIAGLTHFGPHRQETWVGTGQIDVCLVLACRDTAGRGRRCRRRSRNATVRGGRPAGVDEHSAHRHADRVGTIDAEGVEHLERVAAEIADRVWTLTEGPCRAASVTMVAGDHPVLLGQPATNSSGHTTPDTFAPITNSNGVASAGPYAHVHSRYPSPTSTNIRSSSVTCGEALRETLERTELPFFAGCAADPAVQDARADQPRVAESDDVDRCGNQRERMSAGGETAEVANAIVRGATGDDFDAWFELFQEVADEGRWIGREGPLDRDERRQAFERTLDDSDIVTFLAEADGLLLGALGVTLAGGLAELGMMVRNGHRGQGIGSTLLAACVAWCRARDAHKLALMVWPHNKAAISLYRKFGFRVEGRLVRHYRRRNGELWDALAMGLILDSTSPGSSYEDEPTGEPPTVEPAVDDAARVTARW